MGKYIAGKKTKSFVMKGNASIPEIHWQDIQFAVKCFCERINFMECRRSTNIYLDTKEKLEALKNEVTQVEKDVKELRDNLVKAGATGKDLGEIYISEEEMAEMVNREMETEFQDESGMSLRKYLQDSQKLAKKEKQTLSQKQLEHKKELEELTNRLAKEKEEELNKMIFT